jgi:hypothetical protein
MHEIQHTHLSGHHIPEDNNVDNINILGFLYNQPIICICSTNSPHFVECEGPYVQKCLIGAYVMPDES